MTEARLRQAIEALLRREPYLYANYKRGKAVQGYMVGRVLQDLQGGFNPKDVHIAVVEVLATCTPPLVTEQAKLGLVTFPEPKPKNGWRIYEDSPHEQRLDLRRWESTDAADKYRGDQGTPLENEGSTGLMVMQVLPCLNGREWNNAALNVVRALRPSALRVTSGVHTVDKCAWRVTVWLEPNNRTIKSVEQEVEVGLIGCRYASDVSAYLAKETPSPHEPPVGLGIFSPGVEA